MDDVIKVMIAYLTYRSDIYTIMTENIAVGLEKIKDVDTLKKYIAKAIDDASTISNVMSKALIDSLDDQELLEFTSILESVDSLQESEIIAKFFDERNAELSKFFETFPIILSDMED